MTGPTAYRTVAGCTVTPGFRPDAMYGPAYTYECGGCDGIGGCKTAEQAGAAAKRHAARCTDRPADDGAPLEPGDSVRVRDDSPHYAGRRGTVAGAENDEGMFGYWVDLTGPAEQVWVLAAALIVLQGGGVR